MSAAATPSEIGPFRIERPLGRGGMGVVFQAVHRESGQEVALKTVAGVEDPDVLAGIRREIHALARLSHPGIVSIVDHGTERGVPWYAMSLVAGPTLSMLVRGQRRARGLAAADTPSMERGWTELSRSAPERDRTPSGSMPVSAEAPSGAGSADLPRILRIVGRLCAPLAYLHGEGIVHRDLKPANVILAGGDRPVIVDFGLAARFSTPMSRERLRLDETAVGTVAYLAPEQGQGELVDARADLYALGCLLYELVAGRPPFLGAAFEVLQARYVRSAEALSSLVPGVPPELDLLVARLLEREPSRRLGHAVDVARILGRIAPDADAPGLPRPRTYLYQPGFRGREATLEELSNHLAEAELGEGRVVLLGGESGIGKTRLAMALASRAADRHGTVLLGECPPLLGDGSGSTGGDALAAAARDRGALPGRRSRGGRAGLRCEAPAARALPASAPDPDG